MADKRPIVDPVDLQQLQPGDRLEVDGIVNPTAALTFQDQDEGPHPLVRLFRSERVTGVRRGGLITVDTATTFDVSAGSGQIVDTTDPENEVVTNVTWSAQLAQALPDIASQVQSFVLIDSGGSVVTLTPDAASLADRHDKIFIGIVFHTDLASITNLRTAGGLGYNSGADYRDAALEVGDDNVIGNVFSANGANLSMDRSPGFIRGEGLNFHVDKVQPSVRETLLDTLVTFDEIFTDPAAPAELDVHASAVTVVDPDIFNPNGAGTTAAVSANKFTIKRLYLVPDSGVFVVMGEQEYSKKEDALSAIQDALTIPRLLRRYSVFRGWLLIKVGTTNLQNLDDAEFIESTSSTGEGISGSAGEVNTATNVGGAVEVFKQKTGVDLELRTFQSDDSSVSITQNTDTIDFSAAGVPAISIALDVDSGSIALGAAPVDMGLDLENGTHDTSVYDFTSGDPDLDVLVAGFYKIEFECTLLSIGTGAVRVLMYIEIDSVIPDDAYTTVSMEAPDLDRTYGKVTIFKDLTANQTIKWIATRIAGSESVFASAGTLRVSVKLIERA